MMQNRNRTGLFWKAPRTMNSMRRLSSEGRFADSRSLPFMAAYLAAIPSLHGKKIECFVTEYFPFPSMGGNQAIKQMRALCEGKGGDVVGTGIINWSNPKRNRQISRLVEKQSVFFPKPASLANRNK